MRWTAERAIALCFTISGAARATVWLIDLMLEREERQREFYRLERQSFLHLLDTPLYDHPA